MRLRGGSPVIAHVVYLGNITLINKTIGDSHRIVIIEVDGMSARIADDCKDAIEMDRIDNILVPLSVSPNILKMDIEGSEFNVLNEEKFLSQVRGAVIETHSGDLPHLCGNLLGRKVFNTK